MRMGEEEKEGEKEKREGEERTEKGKPSRDRVFF